MRYGVYLPNYGLRGEPDELVELARRAEAAGWDGFFVWDHLVGQAPVTDPWVMLGAIAVSTERIAIGPMIVPLARRRAQKVAVEAATLARLAPGRFILGVGMGVPDDFARFGEETHWRARARKVDESLAFLRRAWAGENVGTDDAPVRVVAEPVRVPVWVSGEWPRRQPFHGVQLADGVFPIARDAAGSFAPLEPAAVRACRESLPAGAQRDFAVWGWADPGTHPTEDYEEAGATWWMRELWQAPFEDAVAIVDAGPGRNGGRVT
jgi:alkanesulfonate monooxygenase SsuD/methylene tetrahydromethanopterin reductase-like flavin-dependent oxidoreductase (luciferase family)